METTRRLQKIWGSLALTIPAELAAELGLEAGDEVRLRSAGSGFITEPARRPDPEPVEWAQRMMRIYEEDLRKLADR